MSPLLRRRLSNHGLVRSRSRDPAEVVRSLGAVQAQDYPAAKWAVGLRARGLTDEAVERACDEGRILRTHVLRPTWHFVVPADVRWMLALTAPRIHAANAFYYRKLELDGATFRRSRSVLDRALRDGRHRTRAELADLLRRAGIPTDGPRLVHLLAHAELEAQIVSGPRRGKHFTYALLEERAPRAPSLDREEALAELTRRYFSSHGPATLRDYAWWSGLTVKDARAGIEAVGSELDEEVIDGRVYLAFGSSPAGRTSPYAHLLPNFDEYVIAYKDREPVAGDWGRDPFAHWFVLDGRLAGIWTRAPAQGSVRIEALPYRRMGREEIRRLSSSAFRYARFLGLSPDLALRKVQPNG
jgi:hypothetical protein